MASWSKLLATGVVVMAVTSRLVTRPARRASNFWRLRKITATPVQDREWRHVRASLAEWQLIQWYRETPAQASPEAVPVAIPINRPVQRRRWPGVVLAAGILLLAVVLGAWTGWYLGPTLLHRAATTSVTSERRPAAPPSTTAAATRSTAKPSPPAAANAEWESLKETRTKFQTELLDLDRRLADLELAEMALRREMKTADPTTRVRLRGELAVIAAQRAAIRDQELPRIIAGVRDYEQRVRVYETHQHVYTAHGPK